MKEIISTQKAPAAIGPYSQAVKAGSLLFISGQISECPARSAVQVARLPKDVLVEIEAIAVL